MNEPKLCPYRAGESKSTRIGDDGIERGTIRVDFALCIQDKCAMWRMFDIHSSTGGAEANMFGSIGYCGLAGKP